MWVTRSTTCCIKMAQLLDLLPGYKAAGYKHIAQSNSPKEVHRRVMCLEILPVPLTVTEAQMDNHKKK